MTTGLTRVQLREEVARVFGLHEALATGGAAGTCVDSKLAVYAEDYWNGATVFIKTAAAGVPPVGTQGEERLCWNFVSATGTLAITPNWTGAAPPAAGDTYQIYRRVSKSNVDQGIAHATQGAPIYATLTPSGSTLDYTIAPTGSLRRPAQIHSVWRRELANDDYPFVELTNWQVLDNGTNLILRLPELLNTNDTLYYLYTAGDEGLVTSDTSYVNLPMNLVKARAVVYIIETFLLALYGRTEMDYWGSQLKWWQEKLKDLELAHRPRKGKALVKDWAGALAPALTNAEHALGLLFNPGGDFSNYP